METDQRCHTDRKKGENETLERRKHRPLEEEKKSKMRKKRSPWQYAATVATLSKQERVKISDKFN